MENNNPKKQLEKLTKEKAFIENKHRQLLADWESYKRLSDTQKTTLKGDWDKYFGMVDETKAYKRFVKMKELWRRGDLAKVKEFAIKAKEQLQAGEWEIPKPAYVDPVIIENSHIIIRYKYVNRKITELQEGGYAVLGF
jgi:hypothetical protein